MGQQNRALKTYMHFAVLKREPCSSTVQGTILDRMHCCITVATHS